MEKIYIFGGRIYGQRALAEAGEQVEGFIDNNEALWNTTIQGKPIISLAEYIEKGYTNLIMIAVFKDCSKIIRQLENANIYHYQLFDMKILYRISENNGFFYSWDLRESKSKERNVEGITMSLRAYELLAKCNLNGKGLEIGASHSPLVSKKHGFNIHVMDHLDTTNLKQKYANHSRVDYIEEVDFVWNGEPYVALVGENKYDYIITSHVIEHMPNLIQHLKDCSSILQPGGVYTLAIPDKRYEADYFKHFTSVGECIDDFMMDKTKASKGTIIESVINEVCLKNGKVMWDETENNKEFKMINTLEKARKIVDTDIEQKSIFVGHHLAFTPTSFALLIEDLYALGYIDLSIDGTVKKSIYHPVEFYACLRKSPPNECYTEEKRIRLLKKIEEELATPTPTGTAR